MGRREEVAVVKEQAQTIRHVVWVEVGVLRSDDLGIRDVCVVLVVRVWH